MRDFASAALAFGRGAAIEPGNPVHLHGAAVAARRLGDIGVAETLYRAAIEAAEQLPGTSGSDPTMIAMRLADLYRSQGRYKAAEELCFQVLGSERAGQSRLARSRLHVCLADLYRREGRFAAAEQAYLAAIAHRREIFGDRHPKTVQILPRLADVWRQLGRHGEADALSRQANAVFNVPGRSRAVGHA
jgi:tetratricopeptide (TPR) repeat protein